jgi:NAD(P)-dependent dehydrogenase (short-subunit alcohol dehydrogenase family)
MGELEGKVSIVTGAGRRRGIGRATALALAHLGSDLVVTGTGRDPATMPTDEREIGWKDVESTALEVQVLGRRALPLVVDVTKAEQVEMMVQQTEREFGRVDILVNNAAYARGADRVPTVDLEPHIFQRVMDVKVLGTYLCSRAVARRLIDQGQGGKIVNVASGEGKSGSANTMAYAAANFAQVGMTQSLAKELGPYGINVNCVCPGWVDTSRVDELKASGHWDDLVRSVPIGRLGTDEEVGAFIAYLCTKSTSWIHGQSINIDGGEIMDH